MSVDRSQFKAKPISVITDAENNARTFTNDRPGFHTLDEGFNHFRIGPALPGAKSWLYPFCRVNLPMEVDKKDDNGAVIGKEIKPKQVFHAGVHGPRDENNQPLYKDIVDAYRKFASDMSKKAFQKEEDQKKWMKHIVGYRGEGGKWIQGILPNTGYMCYAWKLKDGKWVIGLTEFNVACHKEMKTLSAREDSEGAIVTDPFTDIDTGLPITVIVNRTAANANDKYKLNFRNDPSKGYPIPMPIPDEWLEEFMKQQSIEERYVNVYKRRDFELAIKGLILFDKKNGYNIFENEAWIAIVEEYSNQFDRDDTSSADSDPQVQNEPEHSPTREERLQTTISKGGDDLEAMSRAELKTYILQQELDIRVVGTMKDHEIREAIRTQVALIKDLPFNNYGNVSEPAPEKEVAAVVADLSNTAVDFAKSAPDLVINQKDESDEDPWS